jgi:hypothetical protein
VGTDPTIALVGALAGDRDGEPVRNLWASVMLLAYVDLHWPPEMVTSQGEARRVRQTAEHFFFGRGDSGLPWVAQALGLDPELVRQWARIKNEDVLRLWKTSGWGR